MDAFLSTLSVGDALTLVGWLAAAAAFLIGSYFAFKFALKGQAAELRRLAEGFEAFSKEARAEIDALNARVDGVAERTTRLEERQTMHESLLGRIEQSVKDELRYIRERVDAVFLKLSGR